MTRAVEELIDLLQLPQWGRWARPRIEQEIGYKPPGWTREIRQEYPPESPRGGMPPIRDDYASLLDSKIAQCREEQVSVLLALYAYNMPVWRAAEVLRISAHHIRQHRDSAVWLLCGRLIEDDVEIDEKIA